MKHRLKVKTYIRYADDFVIMSDDKKYLENRLREIDRFLLENLKLNLHPDKVYIKTFASGVDFLGWVNFPNYRVLRTATKRRMVKALAGSEKDLAVLVSYQGLLKHGNAHKLSQLIDRGAII